MAISLIVETGAGIVNANTYATVSDARDFALNRGVVLSSNDDEIAALLIKASDYIDSLEPEFAGVRVSGAQALAFPRLGLTPVLPAAIKKAQLQAVLEQHGGVILMPSFVASDYVVEETVGPITTKYSDPAKVNMRPVIPAIDALLEPFKRRSSGSGFRVVRV